jgi:hypothetical protein
MAREVREEHPSPCPLPQGERKLKPVVDPGPGPLTPGVVSYGPLRSQGPRRWKRSPAAPGGSDKWADFLSDLRELRGELWTTEITGDTEMKKEPRRGLILPSQGVFNPWRREAGRPMTNGQLFSVISVNSVVSYRPLRSQGTRR